MTTHIGSWLANYQHYPWAKLAPAVGFLGVIFAILFVLLGCFKMAWLSSASSIAGIISTVGVSMFPFLLPSSSDPSASLTIWDASSSLATLRIMLFSTMFFLPLIIMYTSWVYYVLRGKVTRDFVDQNKKAVY